MGHRSRRRHSSKKHSDKEHPDREYPEKEHPDREQPEKGHSDQEYSEAGDFPDEYPENDHWDERELEQFRGFLQEELDRLETRASDRIIGKAYNGQMPRKEEAERYRQTKEFKKELKYLTRRMGAGKYRRALEEPQVLQSMAESGKYNAAYSRYARLHGGWAADQARMESEILERIPESAPDLYPAARKLKRKFTIHIGPTNSGKTYDAMKALEEAGSGVYLGPLRLLAFEQFEKLNTDGFPCDLVTGEERVEVPFARFTSSTIEMAQLDVPCRHAVIDEAQMLADPSRGGAWTKVILGLLCENISVCASPDALGILEKLIGMCGDTFEVVTHERMAPLVAQNGGFSFPKDVCPGDALIVFSKRDVHAVASELQAAGGSCSIVYGDLPYRVRHEEARKFAEGESQVVVATDAIGMGMNLPIRRVVFLETVKFDGKEKRPLHANEVKQVAGRAGRYGKYDVGYVSTCGSGKALKKLLETPDAEIQEAVLEFPETLIHLGNRLSDVMAKWSALKEGGCFAKSDMEEKIEACRYAEQYISDRTRLYKLVMLPFDPGKEGVTETWMDMVHAESTGRELDFDFICQPIPELDYDAGDLPFLEMEHKICDLVYAYCDKFGYEDRLETIMQKKEAISSAIIQVLGQQRLEGRVCRQCGRPLSWNYPYRICVRCHQRRLKRAEQKERSGR